MGLFHKHTPMKMGRKFEDCELYICCNRFFAYQSGWLEFNYKMQGVLKHKVGTTIKLRT